MRRVVPGPGCAPPLTIRPALPPRSAMPPVDPFPLETLRYLLRRNDQDLNHTRDGVAGRYYGGRFHIGETNNWVAALCKTLGMLGFKVDEGWAHFDVAHTKEKLFDAVVEWAVREFQAAAKLPRAAQGTGSVALTASDGTLYKGLSRACSPQRRVNVMRAWFNATPRLACPVDLSGFNVHLQRRRAGR